MRAIPSLLQEQLRYVLSRSGFYKKKFKRCVQPAPRLISAFRGLPFTTRSEILADQEQNAPFGSNLCVAKKDIRRIHATSGTTDRPVVIALTAGDIGRTIQAGAACFRSSGVTAQDTVVHCLSYTLWAGGYTDHQSLEATGAAVIPFGAGNTRKLIETILWLRPTAIHCTPSYLSRLEMVLREEFGLKPRSLGLRLGLFGGESGLQIEAVRSSIESAWGFRAMNANYGVSEVLSMFGAECRFRRGLHFMGSRELYPELIDYRNEKPLPLERGVTAELVLSSMRKEAQPLIRYRTRDVITILSTARCRCGQEGFRFAIAGRSDDMIVVKGVNVFLANIEEFMARHADRLAGPYQVLVNKHDPIDTLVLRVESAEKSLTARQALEAFLAARFKERFGLRPEVRLERRGALLRSEGKHKKLFRAL